jgi:hypothetical protein
MSAESKPASQMLGGFYVSKCVLYTGDGHRRLATNGGRTNNISSLDTETRRVIADPSLAGGALLLFGGLIADLRACRVAFDVVGVSERR